MAQDRFKLRNTSQDPAFPKKGLAGFTLRPEVGGRVLAPRAVRLLARAEITAALLADVDRLRALGLVSFTREIGPAVEVDTSALRAELGIAVPPPPDVPVRGLMTDVIMVDELAHFEPEPVEAPAETPLRGGELQAEHMEALVEAAAEEAIGEEPVAETPVEEVHTDVSPDIVDELLAGTPPVEEEAVAVEKKLFTEEELSEMGTKDIDKILVETFSADPKQLYKIGSKPKKIAEILKLQATPAGE